MARDCEANGMTAAELRRRIVRPVMYRPEEAATALGVSDDYFTKRIAPHLRRYRDGRLVLYPVSELMRWAEDNSALPLDEQR
jgi:excisionase family DNA binding protein